ncbi:MAG: DUF1800 family protein, partial [Pseudomonadota bacterium]
LSTRDLPRVASVQSLLDADDEAYFLVAQFQRRPISDQPLRAEAARFLSQATFGPTRAAVDALVASSFDDWLLAELEKPPTLHLDRVLAQFPADGRFYDENGQPLRELTGLPFDSFWRAAIEGNDQLRQRMAFALSQILVVSIDSNIERVPQALAQYMDILTRGAFGNYRDLLEEVTYSPAMSIYLTYLRNQKADRRTGRVPDENYAREILQLFTVGLVELQPNGKATTDSQGNELEIYDNTDITELAKVFTGLSFAGAGFRAPLQNIPLEAFYSPLVMFDEFHSPEAKRFLGGVIPAGTPGRESISQALDIIFADPNLGPFIGRQLIQRFVTSAPPRAYVRRVATAFDNGVYTLPEGQQVGSGQRGNLAAVIAAVLFDPVARDLEPRADPEHGKLREPGLRFTHWARAFEVNSADTLNQRILRNTGSPALLGQQPYGAPSVFNFYRPGYIAVGKETGDAGLTAPELQITNASSIIGYPNLLTTYVLGRSPTYSQGLPDAFAADYSRYAALAGNTPAMLDALDLILTHGTLTSETRERIGEVLELLRSDTPEQQLLSAQAAIIMIMTSPEYIVLR